MTLEEILTMALQKGATDVHLKAGITPVIRRNGTLRPLSSQLQALTSDEIDSMAQNLLDENQKALFAQYHEIDVGYGISGLGRFRISVFKQRGTVRIVVRNIPYKVPSFQDLSLPDIISKIASNERGLILVTGVTGSGKSSTLAAIIDDINHRANKHILTIEDPIEYLIRDKKCLITQREIGVDSSSFSRALRAGLRQDPDVILIGEMRDRDTIEIALMAAETGHLVLSTLHTLDATETINRILAYFDREQQAQIRLQLASVLRAAISQRLCRKKDGSGFVPAIEILINNPRIREMIEDPKQTGDIQNALEEGHAAWGMQSFDQSLTELLEKDQISFEEAIIHCARPEDFRIRYEGITAMDGKKWAQGTKHSREFYQKWNNLGEVEVDIPEEMKKKGKTSGRK